MRVRVPACLRARARARARGLMAALPGGAPAEDGSELRSHACGVAKVETRGRVPGVGRIVVATGGGVKKVLKPGTTTVRKVTGRKSGPWGRFVEQGQQPLSHNTDRYDGLVVVAPVQQNIHPFRGVPSRFSQTTPYLSSFSKYVLAGPPHRGPGSGRSAVPSVTLSLHPYWVSNPGPEPPSEVDVVEQVQ